MKSYFYQKCFPKRSFHDIAFIYSHCLAKKLVKQGVLKIFKLVLQYGVALGDEVVLVIVCPNDCGSGLLYQSLLPRGEDCASGF